MKNIYTLIFTALCLILMASLAQANSCYTLSYKKKFNPDDKSLPLLCIRKDNRRFSDSSTRLVRVERKIGKSGVGIGEYVAKVRRVKKCRNCNKATYQLMNVPYDSPYLVFDGKAHGIREKGTLMFRGEAYHYAKSNRK